MKVINVSFIEAVRNKNAGTIFVVDELERRQSKREPCDSLILRILSPVLCICRISERAPGGHQSNMPLHLKFRQSALQIRINQRPH